MVQTISSNSLASKDLYTKEGVGSLCILPYIIGSRAKWGGYNHWTGLLEWTTELTQTAKYTSFSAE